MLNLSESLLQWAPIFWLVIAIVLGVAEAATVQLVAIWFALGALAAIIPAQLGASLTVQFGVFVAVAAVAFALTRPFVKKLLHQKKVRTNADSMIGRIGIVIVPVDNFEDQGRVSLAGLDWAARSEDGEPIPEGERVLIKSIEGVKVIVERIL